MDSADCLVRVDRTDVYCIALDYAEVDMRSGAHWTAYTDADDRELTFEREHEAVERFETPAATSIVGASLSRDGSRIQLRGEKHNEASEFYHTLPGSRWSLAAMCWQVDATPASAWRIMEHCPVAVEADEPILALASSFARSLKWQTNGQPPTRKLDAWRHQLEAYHFAYKKTGALLAMDMGTGKSRVAIDLILNRDARTTLILCPVSVLPVWRREFEKHADEPVDVLILDKGSVAKKAVNARLHVDKCTRLNRRAVVAINYESAWREAFAQWSLSVPWDYAVLDESHRVKSHNSKVSKYAAKLGKVAKYRIALTGTPMPHSPLDLFGQFRFLDRGLFGTWFHHFRNRYARVNEMFPSQVLQWLNQDELKERMALITYRVGAEVLDLPEALHHRRSYTLSGKGKQVYQQLEGELIADVEGGTVTAANALVRLLRLQQATSGYAVLDESQEVVEVDDGKRFLLLELLDDMDPSEPVIVFCRFRHDLDVVQGVAEKLGRTHGELSGRVKDALTDRGTMAEGVQIAGVQIQAGGVGIDLTRARYAVYFSVGFSLGEYLQSLARVHRPGQTRTTHYYHLVASGTVDEAVYGALKKREQVVESVLEVLKR